MHVSQDPASDVEIQMLMGLENNIITPGTNSPVVKIVQDALVGAYLMSAPNCWLERHDVFDICMVVGKCHAVPPPAIAKPSQRWSGTQLLSMLFPIDFNLTLHGVKIQNGIITEGRLTRKHLGQTEGGIIHRLWIHYGPAICSEWIGNLQRLVNHYMTHRSFSVGIEDCFLPNLTALTVQHNLKEGIEELTNPYQSEEEIRRGCNALRDEVAIDAIDAFKKMGDGHGFTVMATSGSKGGNINISQITTCVGQQNVQGQRIKGSNGRASSHFSRFDPDPRAAGFVSS